jgi:hypothetical protein
MLFCGEQTKSANSFICTPLACVWRHVITPGQKPLILIAAASDRGLSQQITDNVIIYMGLPGWLLGR